MAVSTLCQAFNQTILRGVGVGLTSRGRAGKAGEISAELARAGRWQELSRAEMW